MVRQLQVGPKETRLRYNEKDLDREAAGILYRPLGLGTQSGEISPGKTTRAAQAYVQ